MKRRLPDRRWPPGRPSPGLVRAYPVCPATVLGHGRPPVVPPRLAGAIPIAFCDAPLRSPGFERPLTRSRPAALPITLPRARERADCRGTSSTGQGLRGGLLAVEMAEPSDDQRTPELIGVITWLDGRTRERAPASAARRGSLSARPASASRPAPRLYLDDLAALSRLGVEHPGCTARGADHVLFVLGLILLVTDLRMLLWCITAFTLGHSLTLAAATLDLLRLPGPPVEILIALSIVFWPWELAQSVTFLADLANPQARRSHGGSAALLALSFGLLHGLGFRIGAGRRWLADGATSAGAALSFNAGVEVGQLIWVIAWLPLWRLYRRTPLPEQGWLRLGPAYVLGSLAAALTLSRLFDVFSWPG